KKLVAVSMSMFSARFSARHVKHQEVATRLEGHVSFEFSNGKTAARFAQELKLMQRDTSDIEALHSRTNSRHSHPSERSEPGSTTAELPLPDNPDENASSMDKRP